MNLFTSSSRPVRQLTIDMIIGVLVFLLIFAGSVLFLSDNLPHHHQWIRVSVENQDKKSDPNKSEIQVYGGSSVSFGYNFEFLNAVSDRPVLNYGLHAGLGLDTLMRRVEANAGKGDIVILQLEGPYYGRKVPTHLEQEINIGFTNKHYGLTKFASIKSAVQTSYPIYWGSVKEKYKAITDGKRDVPETCGSSPLSERLKKTAGHKNLNLGPYCEVSYNILGPRSKLGRVTTFRITEEVETRLKTLQQTLNDRGAEMWLAPPPVIDRGQKILPKVMLQRKRFFKKLDKRGFKSFCTEIPAYDQFLFADTYLHLNHVGSFIRSMNFASCLSEKNLAQYDEGQNKNTFLEFLKLRENLDPRYGWEQAILDLETITSKIKTLPPGSLKDTNNRWVSLGQTDLPTVQDIVGPNTDLSAIKYRSGNGKAELSYSGLEKVHLLKDAVPDYVKHCKDQACDSIRIIL